MKGERRQGEGGPQISNLESKLLVDNQLPDSLQLATIP
jgi:hypothetical protein